MDSQSINYDEFKGDFDLDIGIDYDFLSEILNSETQENSTIHNLHDNKFDVNLGITEFDITEFGITELDLNLNVEPKNGGWVKRRRLKKGTIEYFRWKEEIKLKNRISARKSIEKKEAYIRELEANFRRLEAENRFRRRVMQIFPNSKPAGRLCGLRRAFSTSDFYVNKEVVDEEEVHTYF